MVGTYLTPGVYVEELPGGARAIEGVATSVTLFLGYTLRGPTGVATRIASWDEYERSFGGVVDGNSVGINDLRAAHGLDSKVPDVDYVGHSAFAYFQNGGAVAYVCRIAEGDTGNNPVTPLASATAAITAPAALTYTAVNEGSWGNGLVVDVGDDAANPGHLVATIGRLNAKGELVPLERFNNLDSATNSDRFVGTVVNRQSQLIDVAAGAANGVTAADSSLMHGTHRSAAISDASVDLSATAVAADRTITVAWATANNAATVAVEAAQTAYPSLAAFAAFLESGIRSAAALANANQNQGRAGTTVRVVRAGNSSYLQLTSGLGDTGSVVVVKATGLGATLGFDPNSAVTGASTIAAGRAILYGGANGYPVQGPMAYVDALTVLELNPDVNVILTPNAAWDNQGQPIVDAVIAHCEKMRNRVTIIDPPRDTPLPDPVAVNSLVLPTSTYTQVYYPWPQVANPVYHPVKAPSAPTTVLVPPSGFAAGMWSRIDSRRGVWKSPAGTEALLAGVDSFQYDIGDPQQEVLNPVGVNALRLKPGYGRVIWGARTLATNASPEWRYIAVRRTAIMIEEAIRRAIQWAVFEPNDFSLWSTLRSSADAYMEGLFRSGAFQGEKASEAYQVSCGLGQTMVQGDIDRGYVILKVKFAPLKPAEFVVIQIQQLAGQA